MKKFLRNIILFFVLIVLVDILFGIICQYMNDHSKGGGYKSRHYVCKETNEEVLIFGSSRARSHYIPDIIEDSLGLSCYNAGEDGNGIILSYGYLKMIVERYSPRIIIYDVYKYDIYRDDNVKYLDLMKPYYYESGIDSIFWEVEPQTRFMMFSNLYRFNTSCIRLLGDFLHPMTNYPNGYVGLKKTLDYESEVKKEKEEEFDTLKIHYFDNFIKLAQSNDIRLICIISPSYNPISDIKYEPINKLCEQYGVTFINYSGESELSHNKLLFADMIHLNDSGARQFTKMIISRIKETPEMVSH